MESAIVASANQSSPSPFAMVHRPGPSGNALEGVGLKYWRAIPGDCGNEEAGGILVDGAHGRWPRRSLGPQIIIQAVGPFRTGGSLSASQSSRDFFIASKGAGMMIAAEQVYDQKQGLNLKS